jgi:hypothetical protein
MLTNSYKTKAEVPAALAEFYVEHEGAWVLDVEDRGRLAEFRTNNRTLKAKSEAAEAELAALRARFDGVDPDEAKKGAAERQALIEQQQLKAGEIEKVMAVRVSAARAEADKLAAAANQRLAQVEARLAETLIDKGVMTLATKRGLRPTAVPDITSRARQAVRLVDGVPVVFEGDGQTRQAGKDGVSPMTLEEWIETQASDAPHLFETNAGSGAAGNIPGGNGGFRQTVKNPFLREGWNLTEQMKLMKTDPNLAERLRAAVP